MFLPFLKLPGYRAEERGHEQGRHDDGEEQLPNVVGPGQSPECLVEKVFHVVLLALSELFAGCVRNFDIGLPELLIIVVIVDYIPWIFSLSRVILDLDGTRLRRGQGGFGPEHQATTAAAKAVARGARPQCGSGSHLCQSDRTWHWQPVIACALQAGKHPGGGCPGVAEARNASFEERPDRSWSSSRLVRARWQVEGCHALLLHSRS